MDGCSGTRGHGSSTDVPRPDPEGAINLPADQFPSGQQLQQDDRDAYDDHKLTEDEKVALLKDSALDVAFGDVGLQPSLTQMAPEALLPAKEETPLQPLISVEPADVIASASDEIMSSDTALSPSQTRVVSQPKHRHVTDTEDSYVDTDGNYQRTKLAINKLQQNRLQTEKMDTSTDEDRRKSFGDSGRRFPPVRKSVTPDSVVTAEETLTPGRSSTSTFLLDSNSSDSDIGVVRTLTLRSIAKMKRQRLQKSSPKILVIEPESSTMQPHKVATPTSVRDRSRSQTPHSSADRTKTASNVPAVFDLASVSTAPSPAPPSDHIVEIPDRQTAPLSRIATPANQILPGSPAVPDRQPTSVTQPSSVSQAGPLGQSVHIPVDNMKDVQKVQRTDAEGRKTTIYKLTPKAGSIFPAPMWPAFATSSNLRSTSLHHGASGDQALPAPGASIRIGESTAAPAKESLAAAAAARFSENRRFTGADQQIIHRLKTLADQRGENMLPSVLQEIQGTSAKAQVRSAGLAQVTALQGPLTKATSEDISASLRDKLQSSAQGRLTYAPFRADEPLTLALDQQLSDDNVDRGYHPESDGLHKPGVSDSLSNFPYLSGERSHTELIQRLTFDVSVPDVTNNANIATSQFLQDRFSSQKKCFRGLTDTSPQDYLNGVPYEDLQPETKSLLNRMSSVGVKPEVAQHSSELRRIRTSFSSLSSDKHLSQARLDYPDQPSSSKLARVGRRVSFLPSDPAQPDNSLHPSFSKIAPKQMAQSSVDLFTPDEFLHPSLHRMNSTPRAIPATLDNSLHPSFSKISPKQTAQSSVDLSTPDEFLYPSLHRINSTPNAVPATLDYPQQPSSSKLAQVGQRLNILPSDVSHPDDFLHPSLSKIALKQTAQSSADMSKPDEFLHPSSHRMTSTPSIIPARPDDALHSSETKLRSSVTHIAAYDEAQHPSLSRLKTKVTSQTLPVPAKLDDYLHPSLTRVQPMSSGPVTRSGKLRKDVEATTTTTTVMDREYFLYDEPARPDDILHPSSTRIASSASTRSRRIPSAGDTGSTKLQTAVPVKPDNIQHPSSTRVPVTDRAKITRVSATTEDAVRGSSIRQDGSTHPSFANLPVRDRVLSTKLADTAAATSITSLDRKETLPSVPARTDDILHPSSTQFPPRVSARGTLDSTISTTAVDKDTLLSVPAGPDNIKHPYRPSMQFPLQEHAQARATLDSATSTTDVGRKETLPERPLETMRPSFTELVQHDSARTTLDSATSTTTLRRKDTSQFVSARPDDIVHPSSTRFQPHETAFQQRDSTPDTLDTATSTTFLQRNDTVNQSPTQLQQRDSTRDTLDTSASTTSLGRKDTYQSVSGRSDDTTHPSATHFLPRESAADTLDSVTLTTTADRKQSLPASARSNDIMHPSSTQFPSRDSVQGAFDTTTSIAALNKKETLQPVTTRPDDIPYPLSAQFLPQENFRLGSTFDTASTTLPDVSAAESDDIMHSFSTQLPFRDNDAEGTFDTETPTTTFGWKETSPLMPVRPDDTLHPPLTQFSPRDTANSTKTIGRKETLSSVPARPDDVIHPSSTHFRPSESTRGTMPTRGGLDIATSTVGLSRKETLPSVSARPDDITHPSSTQFQQSERTRGTKDNATSTTALERKQTLAARPDDLMHPSSTQFGRRDSTSTAVDTATSTTALDRTEALVAAKRDDIQRTSSSTEFSAHDSTGGIFDRAATSISHIMGYDDWQTIQSEEWAEDAKPVTDEQDAVPSFLRRRSDLQPPEDKYQTSPLAEPETSYPSEFMHPSLTKVGKDRAFSDSAGRPSSMRITDQDNSGKVFVSGSRSTVDGMHQDDVRSTKAETAQDDKRLSDRQSIAYFDDMHIGRTGLPSEMRRSSMKSASGQRETLPLTPITTSETSANVDSNRQRRTVTWAVGPRAKSDADVRLEDSVSSVDRRSLPNILDSGSPRTSISAASAPSAMMTDWSYGRTSVDGRQSTSSDVTIKNYINARDSRIVTQEHVMKRKQQEDMARSDEHSYDMTNERQRIEAAVTEDEPAQCADSSRITSSERESAVRIGRVAGAADDVSLRQQYVFDSSFTKDVSLTSLVVDHQFVETEDWLLECPSASVSRPPCRDLNTVEKTPVTASTSGSSDIRSKPFSYVGASLGERETHVSRDDDRQGMTCTTSYATSETTLSLTSRGSSSCDATASTTCYDMAAPSHSQLTRSCIPSRMTQTHAAETSRVPDRHHREPPCVSRTSAGRNFTDCCARPTDVRTMRYGRDYCSANIATYQSPFARGFVPPTPSTYRSQGSTHGRSCQPYQPSRQPPTQQV